MLTKERLGAAIKSAIKLKGVTQKELAAHFGVKSPSVSGWIKDGRIDKEKLPELFDYFSDVVGPEHWGLASNSPFIRIKGNAATALDGVNLSGVGNVTQGPEVAGWIPLISWVQAGDWSEAIDLYEPGYADKVAPISKQHSLKTFALRVEGDSMTAPPGSKASFVEGTVIYVDPEQRGGTTPGDFVIARKKGENSVTFKQLGSEEGKAILKPLNPSPDYPIIRDEFEVLGKVIYAVMDFG